MKIVEKVLERRLLCMVKVDEMQFGFMLRKGMIDAVFILRRLQGGVLIQGEEVVYVLC